MKILWFANTPCGAANSLGLSVHAGGWLNALEQQILSFPELELHIAFHWHKELEPFQVGRTHYYPIKSVRTRERLMARMRRTNPEAVLQARYQDVINLVSPDLVHIHGTEKAFGIVLEKLTVPSVVSIQGLMSNYLERYFSGIGVLAFLRGESFPSHLRGNSALSQYFVFKTDVQREQRILAQARNVIGRTDWDRRSTKILAPNAQYHHGDEILGAEFYEKAWSKSSFSKPLRLVTVTGNAPYKGYEMVVKTASLLKRYGFDFQWDVIGLNKKASIVQVVERCKTSVTGINLLGRKTAGEIRDILLESDIYCQVSHAENSPNSLCEAMLVGMPIIASDAGGTGSLMQVNQNGWLVQDGDPWALAGSIMQLSGQFDQAKTMGQLARVAATERHSSNRIGKELVATYRHILSVGDAT